MTLCNKCKQRLMATVADAPQKRPRGRPKKYLTKEEWQEAKRVNSSNTYKRHTEEMKAVRGEYKKEHADEIKIKAKERYERKKDVDKVNRLLKRIARLMATDSKAKLDENARVKLIEELQAVTKAEAATLQVTT
jgi:hypothetical protein